jgi:hypothetical protein
MYKLGIAWCDDKYDEIIDHYEIDYTGCDSEYYPDNETKTKLITCMPHDVYLKLYNKNYKRDDYPRFRIWYNKVKDEFYFEYPKNLDNKINREKKNKIINKVCKNCNFFEEDFVNNKISLTPIIHYNKFGI